MTNAEFYFIPTRTYATEENARAAIKKVLTEGDRFMVVATPVSYQFRYAPIVLRPRGPGAHGRYAQLGFVVV